VRLLPLLGIQEQAKAPCSLAWLDFLSQERAIFATAAKQRIAIPHLPSVRGLALFSNICGFH
jgi:hypothetical protein